MSDRAPLRDHVELVRSSVAWTWADVDLTIALTDVDGFGCLAVETRPIHVPR